MSIILHCHHCGKKISAPDGTGGKYGKCPACHNEVYIPDLDKEEELTLAPMDEDERKQKEKLMNQTHELTQDILRQRQMPDVPGDSSGEISDKELRKRIILYLRLMGDGELNLAQETAEKIIPYRALAKNILDSIAVNEMPEPELADIPREVLTEFIKNFVHRMG